MNLRTKIQRSKQPISRYMTPLNQTINAYDSVQTARKLMLYYGVSYLPVTNEGQVIGIISHRFLHYLTAFCHFDLHAHIRELMEHDFHKSKENSTLEEVAQELFIQGKNVSIVFSISLNQATGIFTLVDILKCISEDDIYENPTSDFCMIG